MSVADVVSIFYSVKPAQFAGKKKLLRTGEQQIPSSDHLSDVRQHIVNVAPAWRMKVPDEKIEATDGHYGAYSIHLPSEIGDFIVRRKDGAFAYQLVVTIDDMLTGITEVVRGRDLLLSTPQQIFLACELRRLDNIKDTDDISYTHFPLLINDAGQRLSKRDKSLDMGILRQHHTAPEIIGTIAHLAGLAPTPSPITPQALLPTFSWEKVPVKDITAGESDLFTA